MEQQKYNFYIGKALSTITYDKTFINDSGEYVETQSVSFATSDVKIEALQYIYLNTKFKELSSTSDIYKIYIHCYNKQGYLGKIYTNGDEVIKVIDKTSYIRLSYQEPNSDLFVKSRKDIKFLYGLISCNPHYSTLNKKFKKETNQEFFRVSLDGKINLFGNDCNFVKTSSIEDSLIFIMNKYSSKSNKWARYYKGTFNKSDCKFDYDKYKCELKLNCLDEYTNILNNYENTYDLIKLAPSITKINMYKRSLIQIYVLGANTVTNFFGGTSWETEVNEVIDINQEGINKMNNYHFAYIKAANEFYINNAKIRDVNGVYAGENGAWKQQNGYTCYFDWDSTIKKGYFYIKRDKDNLNLYKSKINFSIENPKNVFIQVGSVIEMYNIIDPSDVFTIDNPFVYHFFARLLCDVDSITTSEATQTTYDLLADDNFITGNNLNYKKCIGFEGGLFFCTTATSDEPTKFGINDYNKYFTNQFIPSSTGLERPLPICKSTWANASLWYVYDSSYELLEKALRKQYVLKDSFSISSVINALLKKVDSTILHSPTKEFSKFLYDENMPLNLTRFYIFITQKTNILKGNYDQAAQKAEISFKELMEMLRDCFRCYWFIDDNKLKIEHISYFMNGGSYSSNINNQFDFTKYNDQFNKKQISYFQSEIEYDKSDLNGRYEFDWMDDSTEIFSGLTIDINSNYVQKDKTENISISKFSSDVDYMMFNPSEFSNEGFALLCAIKDNSSYSLPIIKATLKDENEDTFSTYVQNWYASWPFLINFYMYDMPASNITCNKTEVSIKAIKKSMTHTIQFASEEDINELESIKTNIGNGSIDEISININTRIAKVKLVYTPK